MFKVATVRFLTLAHTHCLEDLPATLQYPYKVSLAQQLSAPEQVSQEIDSPIQGHFYHPMNLIPSGLSF